MEHVKVLVVDDHSLVRAGFRSILGDEEDIDVAGEARDGAEAVEAALRERPDVLLMDTSALTSREEEILRLIAVGWTNGEIAEHLFISPLTCKSHVSRILMKLAAQDRIQLVVLAYESGLVVPGRPGGLPGTPRGPPRPSRRAASGPGRSEHHRRQPPRPAPAPRRRRGHRPPAAPRTWPLTRLERWGVRAGIWISLVRHARCAADVSLSLRSCIGGETACS